MIKAVIFDMDGVLIDSEPLWRRAEIDAFAKVDVSLTDAMCRQTTGMRVDELVEYWYHRFPWKKTPKKEVEKMIWENIIHLVKTQGEAKEGVHEVLRFMEGNKIKVALASTSAMILINAVLDKLQIREHFEVIHSAEFEAYGKPHPAVYLSTAKQLEVNPAFCIAIEDSINGMIAAKAAKMRCIAIPDELLHDDKRLGIADVTLSSLKEIDEEFWKNLQQTDLKEV